MRKKKSIVLKFSFLASVILTAIAFTAPIPHVELPKEEISIEVKNAGFEEGSDGSIPEGWQRNGKICREEPYEGEQCAVQAADPKNTFNVFDLKSGVHIPVLPSANYTISVWHKNTLTEGLHQIQVRLNMEGGKGAYVRLNVTNNQLRWQQYHLPFKTPPDILSISIYFFIDSKAQTGAAYWDAVSLSHFPEIKKIILSCTAHTSLIFKDTKNLTQYIFNPATKNYSPLQNLIFSVKVGDISERNLFLTAAIGLHGSTNCAEMYRQPITWKTGNRETMVSLSIDTLETGRYRVYTGVIRKDTYIDVESREFTIIPLPDSLSETGKKPRTDYTQKGFSLVKNGKPAAEIIVPENPTPAVTYAAEEIQYHLELISGSRLPQRNENTPPRGNLNKIFLGPCSETSSLEQFRTLGEGAYLIVIRSNAVILAGRDGSGNPPLSDQGEMGTLFAVYAWLDQFQRVRWLWPGKTGIDFSPRKNVFSGLPQAAVKTLPFIHSRLRANIGMDKIYSSAAEIENFNYDVQVWLRRHRLSITKPLNLGHAFSKYWEKYGSTHPQYFALRPDGIRAPADERTHLVQMCVSSPELHEKVIQDWVSLRTNGKFGINGCENDIRQAIDPVCHCKSCLAWDLPGQTNSFSDRYAKFWLALQKKAMQFDPSPSVMGYAYVNSALPPGQTMLNENIYVLIVPENQLYPTPIELYGSFKKIWGGWSRTGASLLLRPNYLLSGYCLPAICAHEFAEDFKFAWSNNMRGTDFDSLINMWGTQSINHYTAGRLHATPEITYDEIENEYYSAFGNAAGFIKNYTEYWENVTRDQLSADFKKKANYKNFAVLSRSGHLIFTPDTFITGFAILDAAMNHAGNDEIVKNRITFLQKGLTHAELSIKMLAAYERTGVRPIAERDALDSYRKLIRNDRIANFSWLLLLETWAGLRSSTDWK